MTKSRFFGLAAIAGGLLLSLFINYHSFLADFNLVPGDQGDTRLVVFTLEHWFSALNGREAALQLNMFYPDRLALGFADGLFLFAIPYSAFRGLGLDYFTSYQLVLVVLTIFGYGMYLVLLRRVFRLDPYFAVIGSMLLTSLNAMQLQIDIGKLLAFYFWPALILLLWGYARSQDNGGWQRRASLVIFSALLGLLFFTSYYPAWYFVFTALLFGIAYLVSAAVRFGIGTAVTRVLTFARSRKVDLAAALAMLIIALIPFWLTYAPLILSNAGRSFSLVLDYSPTVRDILNVSPQNYVWSALLGRIGFNFGDREVQLGSPLLALLLFVLFYALQVPGALRNRFSPASPDHFIFILATTAILIFALTVQVHGLTLWYLIYRLVPGASALRAVGRYFIVIDMIVVVAVVYGLNRMHRNVLRGKSQLSVIMLPAATALVTVFLIVEQINGTTFRLDKAGQMSFISSFQAPGRDCRAFFIANPTTLDLPVGYYQLDAMMIGMKFDLPTVNGYSGIGPDPVFSMVPAGIEYQYGILNWLRATGAREGICEVSYQARSFAAVPVDAAYDRYLVQVRDLYIYTYSRLFVATSAFVHDGNDLANLYPQYLEQHGYLDASFGFQTGPAYRWIDDKYWIGTRDCGRNKCPAIGIVGSYIEIEDILEGYGPKATQVYFPFPTPYQPDKPVGPDAPGELLLVFPSTAFGE